MYLVEGLPKPRLLLLLLLLCLLIALQLILSLMLLELLLLMTEQLALCRKHLPLRPFGRLRFLLQQMRLQ